MLKERYEAFLNEIDSVEPYERHAFLLACIRSMLQTTALCLLDVAEARSSDEEEGELRALASGPERFFTNDSDPFLRILELLEYLGNREPRAPLKDEFKARVKPWLDHRNDFCHGVPSVSLIERGTKLMQGLARYLTTTFEDFWPASGSHETGWENGLRIRLKSLPQGYPPELFVFRSSGKVVTLARESHHVSDAIFHQGSWFGNAMNRASEKVVRGQRILVRVPAEPEHFVARNAELKQIKDWWDEESQKNVLLLHASGGMGKTVLILRFLHEFFRGNVDTNYIPKVIVFCTAKKSSFTRDGLRKMRAETPTMDHVASTLLARLGVGGASYDLSADERWSIIKTKLAENEWTPQKIVLVIDNAETMTEGPDGKPRITSEQFARELDQLRKDGFRLVVTSRRDEKIKIRCAVEVPALTQDEQREFIRSKIELIKKQSRKKIFTDSVTSETPELRRALESLQGVPILLDVFVEIVCSRQQSLKTAAEHVAGLDLKDLADFLYEDSWKRMDIWYQKILYVMLQLGSCSRHILKKIIHDCGGTFYGFEQKRETEFFDSTQYEDGTIDYVLKDWATKFLQVRFDRLTSSDRESIEEIAKGSLSIGNYPTELYRMAMKAWKENLPGVEELFGKAWAQLPKNERLAKDFAEFCVETRVNLTRDLEAYLLDESDDLGALYVATIHAQRQRPGPFAKAIEMARRKGAAPIEISLREAEYRKEALLAPLAQRRSQHRLPDETEQNWRQREQEAAKDRLQEREQWRREMADHLSAAQEELNSGKESGVHSPEDLGLWEAKLADLGRFLEESVPTLSEPAP